MRKLRHVAEPRQQPHGITNTAWRPSWIGNVLSRNVDRTTYDKSVAAVLDLFITLIIAVSHNSQSLTPRQLKPLCRMKNSAEMEPVFDLGIAAELDGLRLTYQTHPVMRLKSKCNRKYYPCMNVWKPMLFIASCMLGFAWA